MGIKEIASILCFISFFVDVKSQQREVQLKVDAARPIATVTKLFNGTNIEDLNNQTNGGVFSQLLHGEAFEENVEVDFLNLGRKDYSKIYLVLDERRIPHLITQSDIYHKIGWNDLSEKYDFYTRDIYNASPFKKPENLSGWMFYSRFIPFDSIPAPTQKIMQERINGKEQISKFWNKMVSGTPGYAYELVRDGNAYLGRQTQTIDFTDGTGEVGITNHGLYKSGINYTANKPYDGVLRVKAKTPTTIYLSLRDEEGTVLAEKSYTLKGNDTYEKVSFELIPNAGTINGSFGISLKEPGKIELGFAFMQPGEWDRVNGYPIIKRFVDMLKKQGITAIRYNGSMTSVGADTHLYRWKKMIGPIDERRTLFRSGFNNYATHSFGFIEMLQVAEVLDALCVIGMSGNESYEDIRDFVEYVNGAVTSPWGKLRAEHGHPDPYNLKYIQVDNEKPLTPGYIQWMKKFAKAAWEVDPEMTIMTSVNLGTNGCRRGSGEYKLAAELVGWFIEQGKGDRLAWDPHYSSEINFADEKERFENEMGVTLQKELAEDYPGFKLRLMPMEENGRRCDWHRGLAHAHNWNTLQRYGNCFEVLATANTFQPHGLHYMWDQGRIHYTSDAMWFQPSAHIDEMMMQTWKSNVIKTTSSNELLDITAKINDAQDELTLYIANLSGEPQTAVLDIDNFKYKSKTEAFTIGNCELTAFNSYENRDNVNFSPVNITMKKEDTVYTFPKYSYTVVTLRQ